MFRNKRILFGVLLLLSILCVCVVASAGQRGTCGENLTWTLDDNGVLTVSGTGEITNFDSLDRGEVKEAVIKKGTTGIGGWAFNNFSNMTKITIPEGVTSIGDYAFATCLSLSDITIPKSVTSIGNGILGGCSNLKKATVNAETNNIYFGDVFIECTNLEDIEIPADHRSYSSEDGVVYNKEKTCLVFCPQGTKKFSKIPDSVTSIGWGAFYGNTSLTNITIPKNVTEFGDNVFNECINLKTIMIEAPIKIWSFSNLFGGCSKLTIDFPQDHPLYTTKDEVVYDKDETALLYCPKWKSGAFSIPETVSRIDNYAFLACTKLTSITIPKGVWDIGESAFSACTALKSITIPDRVTSLTYSTFCNCPSLTSVTLPNNLYDIGWNVFDGCTSLKSIHIPNSVVFIGDRAFAGCPLTEVTLSKNITSIATDAFDKTVKIKTTEGCYAAQWASENDYECKLLYDLSKATISPINDQNYTGKPITQKATLKYNGKELKEGKDYQAVYANNKGIGKASITFIGKGKYTEEVTAYFNILPKPVKLNSLTADKNTMIVTWKKGSNIDGYEIEYSLKKDFKKSSSIKIAKVKTTNSTISGLKSDKTYYVRIRTYKTVDGSKYYSKWSKVLSQKVK